MEQEQSGIFSSPFNLLPNGREIYEAFLDIPVSTFSIILGLIFWLGLMWLPLTGIDRRDNAAGSAYALFMCFSGTMLIMALGQPREGFTDVLTHLIIVLAIFLAAKFRWINRIDQLKKYTEVSSDEGQK